MKYLLSTTILMLLAISASAQSYTTAVVLDDGSAIVYNSEFTAHGVTVTRHIRSKTVQDFDNAWTNPAPHSEAFDWETETETSPSGELEPMTPLLTPTTAPIAIKKHSRRQLAFIGGKKFLEVPQIN